MHRRASLASALVLTIGLAACGGSSSKGGTTTTARAVTPGATPSIALGVIPGVMTATPAPPLPNVAQRTEVAEPTVVAEPTLQGQPTVTASGLKIFDIQVGTGVAAQIGDSISVNYTGWLENGAMFTSDSTGGSFPLAKASQGWQEGVPGMRVGGKRRLVIPPDLAGIGNGGHTLTFDIELVSIP